MYGTVAVGNQGAGHLFPAMEKTPSHKGHQGHGEFFYPSSELSPRPPDQVRAGAQALCCWQSGSRHKAGMTIVLGRLFRTPALGESGLRRNDRIIDMSSSRRKPGSLWTWCPWRLGGYSFGVVRLRLHQAPIPCRHIVDAEFLERVPHHGLVRCHDRFADIGFDRVDGLDGADGGAAEEGGL
jgi:hypothetical protein